MNINLININDQSFENKLTEMIDHYALNKKCYFIDWKSNDQNTIKLCKSLNEDTPIIIFDRHCSISDSEFLWLNDRNTVLMEPAINHRNGFVFQPYWIDFDRIQFNNSKDTRSYDIGYKGKAYFNDDLTNLMTEISVDGWSSCVDAYIKHEIWSEISKNIVVSVSDYNDYNYLFVYGNDNEIQRGIVPDIRNIVYNGTVPLLWHTHYTMHGLFKNLVINSYSDLRYFCGIYQTIGNLFLDDIIDNINMYMPEMKQENFIQTILNIFEKM